MKNNINQKKYEFNMKRINLFILMCIMLLSSTFAVETYDTYNSNLVFASVTASDYLDVYSFKYLVFSNNTFDIDTGLNYRLATNPLLLYTIYNNNLDEKEFVFVTIYKSENGTTYAYGNFINISGSSSESVVVKPTSDYEYISTEVYCVSDSSTCGSGYQVTNRLMVEKKDGVSSVFAPLINGVVDLITINVTIWKALFWIFIIVVVSAFIGGLFWIGFKILKASKDLENGKGLHGTRRDN